MSNRSSSPDPIQGPVSPDLIARRNRRESTRPPPASQFSYVSPSPAKSFIMDTGTAENVSPWRIKVTVEAQPKEDTASAINPQKGRTTKVPLKGLSSSPSRRASPAKRKRATPGVSTVEDEPPIRRPQRKRKGTPIGRKTKTQREDTDLTSDVDDAAPAAALESPSPVKKATKLRAKRQSPKVQTERTKRAMHARKELNEAIEDAVRSSDPAQQSPNISAAGDMTVANEDFTMVSVETLQSMKNNTSMIDESKVGNADKSGLSASYWPSSPPPTSHRDIDDDAGPAEYPDLTEQVHGRDTPLDNTGYDAMSWKPTGPAVSALSPPHNYALQEQSHYNEPSEWRRERKRVSQQIENANTSQVMVINDDTQLPPASEADEDIWAEEASREEESLIEQRGPAGRSKRSAPAEEIKSTATQINDLFSGQPTKPPRSKIPRTWRRSSGADFSYVDSPAHPAAIKDKKSVPESTDEAGAESGSGRGGVLTPPGTDDEVSKRDGQEDGVDSSLTAQGEGDVTLLEKSSNANTTSPGSGIEDEVSGGESESSDVETPASNDTGLFWQKHLPNLYRKAPPRPQRQQAMDLSDLFAANKSSSPMKANRSPKKPATKGQISKKAPSRSQVGNGASATAAASRGSVAAPTNQKPVDSPLRKSLLKSSKISGGLLTSTPMQLHAPYPRKRERRDFRDFSSVVEESEGEQDNSMESKASDQRQLLNELSAVEEAQTEAEGLAEESLNIDADDFEDHGNSAFDHTLEDDMEVDEQEWADEEQHETTHSYEEHLNIESPQKIKVNFNDSLGNSSQLAPTRQYPSLFGNSQAVAQSVQEAPPILTLSSKPPQSQPGLLSRLSSNLWSALVRPSGPTSVMPTAKPQPPSDYDEVDLPPSLRAQLRSKYGVLPSTYPWTWAHMWTLHRMVNSALKVTPDSIIPKSGPLPAYLESLIGSLLIRIHSDDWDFYFTAPHAYVVHTFMQLLVPNDLVRAMEKGEIEFLGDAEAKISRGQDLDRHGAERAFNQREEFADPVDGSTISMEFVARCVGNVIIANIRNAEQAAENLKAERQERREKRHLERMRQLEDARLRETEEGVGYDDDDDGDAFDERRMVDFALD